MTRELILYCDESDISGKHFANFYGGALVESMHLNEVIETLLASKKHLHLGAEIKWQKISENYAGKYIELMDTTFSLVAAGKLKLRIMFTQNYFGVPQLSVAQRENGFFLLYYQFVKHAFGLQFCTQELGPARLRIYFDKLPDTDTKCLAFKAVVSGLSQSPAFERAPRKGCTGTSTAEFASFTPTSTSGSARVATRNCAGINRTGIGSSSRLT